MSRYIPTRDSMVDGAARLVTEIWRRFIETLAGDVDTLQTQVAGVIGVQADTLANQPTGLGVADAGYVFYVTDYAHLVYWTGTAWVFMDSQGGRIEDRVAAPQGNGWQLCDGTASSYLTVGASLGSTAFTTPNLVGTPAYKKAAAAYTGTINAKSGSTGTGNTGTGTTGGGTTGTGTTGTGTTGGGTSGSTTPGNTGTNSGSQSIQEGTGGFITVAGDSHVHSSAAHTHTVPGLSVPGLSVPGLSVPGLSVPSLSVPALAVGSIDMENLGVLPYFRR